MKGWQRFVTSLAVMALGFVIQHYFKHSLGDRLIYSIIAAQSSDMAQATSTITPTIQAELHVPYDPVNPQPLILGENYPYTSLRPVVKPPLAKLQGVDLDVTYISRMPRYDRYCVEHFEIQGVLVPKLCPGTENEKHNPEPGEIVTFTAHLVNKGTVASEDFAFAWYIDRQLVLTGAHTGMAPGEMVTKTYQWSWSDGDHTVKFVADPENLINETSEMNNWVEDHTNALSFQIGVSPYVYEAFNRRSNLIGSYSFEDWLQQQIMTMNLRFQQAIYPLTPQGILDRVRIDSILVTDPENIPIGYPNVPFEYDGQWMFRVPTDDPNTPENESQQAAEQYANTFAEAIDWGLIHELTHQLGIIDLYNLNHWPEDNLVLDKEGAPLEKGFYWPHGDLMGGGDTSPYNDGTYYSEHTAKALNANRGHRRAYYGEYLYDVPLETYIQLLDNQGNHLAGASLYLYQNNKDASLFIDDVPEITGTTDANGFLLLWNRSVDEGITTATGHTLHNNPFGVINVVGNNGRFLVRIVKGSQEEFHWLDITAFNLAYWEGHTESYTFVFNTHIAPEDAPSPPTSLRAKVERSQVSLRWNRSDSPSVIGYNIYRATWIDYEFTKIATGIVPTAYIDTNARDDGPCYYAVTAVDANGSESAFSNMVGIIWWISPAGLTVDSENRWILTDRHYQRLVVRYPDGNRIKFLGGEHDYHWGLTDTAVDPYGYLYTVGTLESKVKIRDPLGRTLRSFGSPGNRPGQFNDPWGVAVDSDSHIFVADTGNDRIQAFDASGNFIAAYGGEGQLDSPKDIAVDAEGHIIVADIGNDRLQVLTFDGTSFSFVRNIYAYLDSPSALTVDPSDRIIVADTGNNKVKKLDLEGNILSEWDEPNDGYTGRFNQPQGVAVDLEGKIPVSDTGNRRVVAIVSGIPPQPTPTFTPTPTPTPTPTAIPDTGAIKGIVWNDLDADGIQDEGERPLAGAVITIRDSESTLVFSYMTQANGLYSCALLEPGPYTVSETNPPGLISTTPDRVEVEVLTNTVVEVNFGDREHYRLYLPTIVKGAMRQ